MAERLTGLPNDLLRTRQPELGVRRTTVQARLRRLEESGTLRGFRPELDPTADAGP